MIKKISATQLREGMYVHDLNCDWMSHSFFRSRFPVRTEKDVREVLDTGIQELYIDTELGIDIADAPTEQEVAVEIEQKMRDLANKPAPAKRAITISEELDRARRVHAEAFGIVRNVMQEARLGRQVQLGKVEPVVERITESLLRNSGALLSLCRIKNADDYTFLHSVSVGTLMVAFCSFLGMEEEAVRQGGIGGMLHDTGKMKTPLEILNKPGRLTEAEFEVMRRHPGDGHVILLETSDIQQTPLEITLRHHERMDGSGYPGKLNAAQIPKMAQVAAIVDVYDALTADRCYHKGMPPTEALRKLFEWSHFHFNAPLVQEFVRCVGIYPVGSLVILESGRIGVVMEQHESNLLTPKLRVMYSTRDKAYVVPQLIDLSRSLGHGGGDRIVAHADAAIWGIDPQKFM